MRPRVSGCLMVSVACVAPTVVRGEGGVAMQKARLLGMCFRNQGQLDLIEAELRKVETTIRKARDLASRAQASHRDVAEQTALRALAGAEEARANHLRRKQAVAASLVKFQAMLALPDEALLDLKLPEDADDARSKLALQREREECELDQAGWLKKYQAAMREKESPVAGRRSLAIVSSLRGSPVPVPAKTWPELSPGDVILVDPKDRMGERLRSAEGFADLFAPGSGVGKATACHTLVYLKEVHGRRFFLDNQPGDGPRIIPEDVFLERYGHRFLNKASYASRNADGIYVAERLEAGQARNLWNAAMQAHQEGNQQRVVVRNPFGEEVRLDTGYGIFADDLVCSETSRWALIRAGKPVPAARSGLKQLLRIQFGPADFFDPSQPFLITPIGRGVFD